MILRHPALFPGWRSPMGVVAIAAVVCGLAFYAVEHSFTISIYLETVESEALELDEIVAAGSLSRRLAFAGLGVCGLVAWYRRSANAAWRMTLGGLALLAYFAWCYLSILWADDPGMTLRRFGVLTFFFLAMMGLSKQFTLRDLVWIVIGVTAAHLFWGLLVELRLGTFQPANPDYRFAGTVHPNTQGIQCAALCLATFAILPQVRRGRWGLWLLFFAAGLFLILTRSRTSCAATMVALLLIWLPRAPMWVKATVFIGPPLVASGVLLTVFLFDFDVADKITGIVLMGRAEEAGTLTGRIPLWHELANYARQRPLTGYGYGGFWNPQRTRLISENQGWQIAHSHSAYYENLLNLGVMGVLLALVASGLATLRAAARHWRRSEPGDAFAMGLLSFAAAYSVTDAGFALPGFMTLIMAACMARLLLYVEVPYVAADPLAPAAEGVLSPSGGALG